MKEPTSQEIIDEQSRTITRLCEAIDPTHSHGPETDKICAYARQCREFSENSVLLKRIEGLENLIQLQQMTDGPTPICPKCYSAHIESKCPDWAVKAHEEFMKTSPPPAQPNC